MPHNFDLSAYVTKNPDDNKLVIQLKITDIMAYNHSGNWGNNNSANGNGNNEGAQVSAELTWEEQNFMEEEQIKNSKPDFSEYEWMMELEEFDSQAMQKIEQDDDLDDMFYWDPTKGCMEGKQNKKNKNLNAQPCQNQKNQLNQQNQQIQQNPQNQQNQQHRHNTQNSQKQQSTLNPFSSNFQNTTFQHSENKQNIQNTGLQNSVFQNSEFQNSGFQNSGFQNSSFQNSGFQNAGFNNGSQNFTHCQQEVHPADELSRAMGGVDLNKFNLNPDATTFVPSWLKK